MTPPLRFMLIEDDPRRIETFRRWMPAGTSVIVARSAGLAMGMLRRLLPGEIKGLMLDHDLQQQAITDADASLSGSHVVALVIAHVDCDVPALVHSQNVAGATVMRARLKLAGFSVTQVPMDQLTRERFLEWVEDAREEAD
jgi:hypothetical protein